MSRIAHPPRTEFRQEPPRAERLASIGEALEEVLGAYAGRVVGRSQQRGNYLASAGASVEGSMMAFGSLSTR